MIQVVKVSSRGILLSVVFLLGLLPVVVLGHASGKNDEHTFRHQQHYSHRLEQAVNDFKSSQVQWNASQVSLRHHHRTSGGGASAYSTTTAPPLRKHHLRHHNRHHQAWEQRVFPSLHPEMTSAPPRSPTKTSGYNLSSALQSRYFDRDGLYSMSRTKNDLVTGGTQSIDTRIEHGRSVAGRGKVFFGDDDKLTYAAKSFESDLSPKWSESKATRKTLDDSVEDLDEYYNDDEGWDDDDYSDEEQEDDLDVYDDSRNKIDDRSLPKRRISTVDVEDIYSRSYIPGTLTRHKFEMLGTHEAVKQSRKSHITSQKQHRVLANAHASKVYAEARCRTPKPRVEKIQKDPAKLYVPHCTILHRCGDDTGCCNSDAQTCVPKHTQNVDLYFFVKSLKAKQGTIERHTFINHTECHCVERSKHHSHLAPAMLRKATILDCNCPRLFEKVLQEDGVCRCDCSSGNSGCDWIKRGMEHFSMVDRKCIMEGRCKLPTCEYGSYVKKQGRCPRKDDKLSYSMSFH